MNRERVSLILLVFFCAYLFLFGLGKMALLDPDEPFYAKTAREMLNRSEWLTPRIFGEPQFEKPPLYYWFVILSFKVFGVNEFAARFPSAIFGILGIIGIYLLGGLLFSKKTALYSSLIMATAVEYTILARACVTDMVLCVFVLYFFLFFFYGLKKDKKIFYLFSSACLGLAVLTKGPIGFLLPLFIIALFFLVKKEFMQLFKLPFLWPSLIFVVIAVPWYYLMYKVHGSDFIGHFFGFQNITRFLKPEHRIGDIFYYNIPVIFAGFFPWSIFLPYGAFAIIKQDREKFRSHLFLLVWILTFFIFFSISRTKLPTYIFPLFPALAIAVGRSWELILESKYFDRSFNLSGILYLISSPIVLIIFYKFSLTKYPAMTQAILKSGAILSVLVAISLIFFIKRKISLFFGSIVFTLAMSLIPLTINLGPVVSLYESSKEASKVLKNIVKPNERIGVETCYRRGVAFYLDKEDIIDVHPHHVITKFLESKQRVWAVLKDKNHRQLYTDEKKPFRIPTYITYKFGKKVIITNKIPEDGKYIKRRSIDELL
ncbi:MAG: glycosyltransferase family 39 protein [Candidatus Omnitrophica bacterium]|nr:glycosyltransferase family 39 protein [Candidatus Omnitrophota bacterium]